MKQETMMPTKAVQVRVNVPDTTSDRARDTAERRGREAVVLALWEDGEFSTRQAVAELGLTYQDFLDLLTTKGIPVERGAFDGDALAAARKTFAKGKV
jgi:hypothetical protein